MKRIVMEFEKALADPRAYAHDVRAKGTKVVGYFCSYAPEELFEAAGIHPLRIFDTQADASEANAHLQSYSCSLARCAVSSMVRGDLGHLDGVVFPHTCDTMQRVSDIFRLNAKLPFFADVVLPVKLTSESSRVYMREVLERFRYDLEKGFSVSISASDMKKAFETYNTIRSSLASLYRYRSLGASPLTGADLAALARGSMVLERSKAAGLLSELVRMHEGILPARSPLRRIMLVGGVCDTPLIHETIRRAGGDVVWDDLCTGTRYFEGILSMEGDPLDALTTRYFGRAVCPAKHASLEARAERILSAVREHEVQAVVFVHLTFCDPHAFDYPHLKEVLDAHSIPSMLLEVESGLSGDAQLLTRLETFIHMIG